ncbi:MAG: NAD-dependent epimerase/dehydratase family protein [Burkholderiaceae bacterium]|nr:NAD-dependent epimerase/dehydratase family protein [Burkholderiaceae bacterium]
MKDEQVLLVGGTGFIGSALASRLRKDKVPVNVLCRADMGRLHQILPTYSTVVHLASSTTPSASSGRPELEQSNINLTRHLVECLKEQPEIHLIYFSSGGTVYGNPVQLPVTEDALLAPMSPYGIAKVAQEAACQELRAIGHAVTILRPSNAYGPGQYLRDGFGLIRTMLERVRMGTPIEIWGDGENVRDYIYIEDVVEATLRLIQLPIDNGTYNLGSGVGYSVNQIKRMVEAACCSQSKTINWPVRGTDVRRVVLDNSRLSAQLGWRPHIGLERGIAETLDWLRLQ